MLTFFIPSQYNQSSNVKNRWFTRCLGFLLNKTLVRLFIQYCKLRYLLLFYIPSSILIFPNTYHVDSVNSIFQKRNKTCAKKFAVGIDLGLNSSCIAVCHNGEVEMIADEIGLRSIPSYVSFDGEERYIGNAAKQHSKFNPRGGIFDVRKLMGKKFSDASVQNDIKLWPFEVVGDDDDRPNIVVSFCGEEKRFTAEEISAMILKKMKENAEIYLGEEVVDAVITVPTHFNAAERKATEDAGKMAGFNVLSILSEATAAAIAYGLNDNANETRNVVIFD